MKMACFAPWGVSAIKKELKRLPCKSVCECVWPPGAPDTVKYIVFGPTGAPDMVKHVVFGPPGAPDTVKYMVFGPRAPRTR